MGKDNEDKSKEPQDLKKAVYQGLTALVLLATSAYYCARNGLGNNQSIYIKQGDNSTATIDNRGAFQPSSPIQPKEKPSLEQTIKDLENHEIIDYLPLIIKELSKAKITKSRNELEARVKLNGSYTATIIVDRLSNVILDAEISHNGESTDNFEIKENKDLALAISNTYKSRVKDSVESLLRNIKDAKMSAKTVNGERQITAQWRSKNNNYSGRATIEMYNDDFLDLEVKGRFVQDKKEEWICYEIDDVETKKLIATAVDEEFFARKREEFKDFGKVGTTQYRAGE